MAKFKVGDRVVGNWMAAIYPVTCTGWRGVVVAVDSVDGSHPNDIRVKGPDKKGTLYEYPVWSKYFDLDKSSKPASHPDDRAKKRNGRPYKRRVVIEISDDGATAEYIVGKDHKKGVSIKRYYKDTPDDYRAGIYAVAKLFDRKVAINDEDYFSLTEREVRDLEDSLKNAQGYLDDAKAIVKRNAVRK